MLLDHVVVTPRLLGQDARDARGRRGIFDFTMVARRPAAAKAVGHWCSGNGIDNGRDVQRLCHEGAPLHEEVPCPLLTDLNTHDALHAVSNDSRGRRPRNYHWKWREHTSQSALRVNCCDSSGLVGAVLLPLLSTWRTRAGFPCSPSKVIFLAGATGIQTLESLTSQGDKAAIKVYSAHVMKLLPLQGQAL